jgi:lipopolysaccharide biosynthesis protein
MDSERITQYPVRTLAFYLPQFSPNEQNDIWWGKGFTEWTNVTKGKPQFRGHYQPHLPADLGFYDLRVPQVREEQAKLARKYGVYGFCYYHYWFHGRRMLEDVFDDVLRSGKPDFPFCLCWANDTWRKTWNNGQNEILIEQTYSEDDDRNHIKYLIKAFKNPRYIRINGRPIFLIYRAGPMESRIGSMLKIWNEYLRSEGIPELYLCSVRATPPPPGFEANVDFFPSEDLGATIIDKLKWKGLKGLLGRAPYVRKEYTDIVNQQIKKPYPDYKNFFCSSPNWDNSARRSYGGAFILNKSTPGEFRRWFDFCVRETMARFNGDERIVFVNAWNEWGEGAHLEPDQKWGLSYLEAISEVLKSARQSNRASKAVPLHSVVADDLG